MCFGSSLYNGLCAPIWINSHMKELFIIIIIIVIIPHNVSRILHRPLVFCLPLSY